MNSATLDYLRDHRSDSPKEIAAALAVDFRTTQNIDRKALAAYLLEQRLLRRFRDFRAQSLPDELKPLQDGLEELNDIIVSGIDYVGTMKQENGRSMTLLLSGLTQAGVITSDESTALLGLSGGYLLERLTAEEVSVTLTEMDAENEQSTLRARAGDGYNAVVTAIDAGETDWQKLVAVFAGAE